MVTVRHCDFINELFFRFKNKQKQKQNDGKMMMVSIQISFHPFITKIATHDDARTHLN